MGEQFFRFRLDPGMRRLLDKLRDEKDINLSRWVQRQVRNALKREFPDHAATETQMKPPIAITETQEPEPPQTPTIRTREIPEPDHATTGTPKKPPIDGWKPRRLDSGEWGAVLEGGKVAELLDSDQLPGTAISITDSKGDSWTTTIVAVVSRSDAVIVVTTAGRPRD